MKAVRYLQGAGARRVARATKFLSLFGWAVVVLVLGEDKIAATSHTVHCITKTEIFSGETVEKQIESEMWVSGANSRVETKIVAGKMVQLLAMDGVFTFSTESKKGFRMKPPNSGAQNQSLWDELAEIRKNGKPAGAETVGQILCDKFELDRVDRKKTVWLSQANHFFVKTRTQLKRENSFVWVTDYKDVDLDKDLPDSLFKLPPDVTITDMPAQPK